MSSRRILFGLVFALVAIGAAGFLALTWHPAIPEIRPPPASAFDRALIAKGAELAAIGNCVNCHTTRGGKPFAGGLPIPTPFGTIYSTNITPDPDSGIGKWSRPAFFRAMREGVDRRGSHLYPAFPYDHFAKVTDADLEAISAFLMTRHPTRSQTVPNELFFPINFRLAAAAWKFMFLDTSGFRRDPLKSTAWNRGAYLVEGLGHCGSCHTPHNALGAERRQDSLAGGEVRGWVAPALNSASLAPIPWNEDAIFNHLRHGWDPLHGVAAGPMMPVVRALVLVPEQDVRAIATYIASLAGEPAREWQKGADEAVAFATSRSRDVVPPGTSGEESPSEAGSDIFTGACATCHHRSSATDETRSKRPADLALNTSVNLPEPRNLVRVIRDGIIPEGGRAPMMPGFADALTDQQMAALAGYLRRHFSDRPPWPDLPARVREISRERRP